MVNDIYVHPDKQTKSIGRDLAKLAIKQSINRSEHIYTADVLTTYIVPQDASKTEAYSGRD